MTSPRPRPADSDTTRDARREGTRSTDALASTDALGEDTRSEEKPVDEWVTGDEPMTGPQRSYLKTLAHEAGEDLPEEELTKAAASELIERLQRATGRIPADRDR